MACSVETVCTATALEVSALMMALLSSAAFGSWFSLFHRCIQYLHLYMESGRLLHPISLPVVSVSYMC